jgi:hypothetical protein
VDWQIGFSFLFFFPLLFRKVPVSLPEQKMAPTSLSGMWNGDYFVMRRVASPLVDHFNKMPDRERQLVVLPVCFQMSALDVIKLVWAGTWLHMCPWCCATIRRRFENMALSSPDKSVLSPNIGLPRLVLQNNRWQ